MRYEDVQPTPRVLKVLLGVLLCISIAVNGATMWAVMEGLGSPSSVQDGWLGTWAWFIPAPLILAFSYFIFAHGKMKVWIDDNEVRIRMRPFHIADRRIPWRDVTSAQVRKIIPFSEFGGWGIRWNPFTGKTGYIWGGKHALELTLVNGKRIVVSINDGDALREGLNGIKAVTVS